MFGTVIFESDHMNVLERIKELEHVSGFTKKERIIQGVRTSILEDSCAYGEYLPSVNELSSDLGYARETVVKAYGILKDRGIVGSKHGVGYYVSGIDTKQELTVAVVLYSFHAFQEKFYNTFREHLGDNVKLDIYFHHNNTAIYQTIINGIKGRYGMYVVAPIHDRSTQELLSSIPAQRLLLIDRYESLGSDYSYISQEFEKSTYDVLTQLTEAFSSFDKKVLFYRDDADHPVGVKRAFEAYCSDHAGDWAIHKRYDNKLLKKGYAYITLSDIDLWELLKDCKLQGLEIGKDVGVLSSNDSPVKEIVSGGITTFFADFEHMAKKAAEYVESREQVKEILEVQLWRRRSL